jgi:hypothetical protein
MKLVRLLKKLNMRTIHKPKRKTAQMLRSAKAELELKVPGVYRILLECGKVYVLDSGKTIEARCEVQHRCILDGLLTMRRR